MLRLDNISVDFSDFSLKNIYLTINPGEYRVLLGPSGSGKTLILNCITGFQKLNSGQIFYLNKNITNTAANKRNISFLFQDLALFPHLNVNDNLAYPLKIKGLKNNEIQNIINEYLDFTEIKHLKDRTIDKLSGGEKQRVAIARCLINGNKMILLDEPFSAIDSQLLLSLKKLLKRISAKGISIIHVTHNFEEAINMAHKISVIENGCLLQTGTIDEIFNKPASGFVANFSGKKNHYLVEKAVNINNTEQCLLIKTQKSESIFSDQMIMSNLFIDNVTDTDNINSGNYVPILASKSNKVSPKQGIIIDMEDIIIAESPFASSARNNFTGIITSIFPVRNAYEIEIYCGINLWVKITEQSFQNMNIKEGKEIHLSFKATAVKIL